VTRSSDDEVTLAREVEHARVYADIQELRYVNRVRIDFDEPPPAYAELAVPRLILQPLIENAIEHGLPARVEDAWCAVRFHADPRGLSIAVEDNGAGISDEAYTSLMACLEGGGRDSDHTALSNINRRIRLKFGRGSGLTVERPRGGGVTATIRIAVEAPCTAS
jgi:two-component system, sensor histidine kinase YesM